MPPTTSPARQRKATQREQANAKSRPMLLNTTAPGQSLQAARSWSWLVTPVPAAAGPVHRPGRAPGLRIKHSRYRRSPATGREAVRRQPPAGGQI